MAKAKVERKEVSKETATSVEGLDTLSTTAQKAKGKEIVCL